MNKGFILITEFKDGGAEKIVLNLLKALEEKNYKLKLIVLEGTFNKKFQCKSEILELNLLKSSCFFSSIISVLTAAGKIFELKKSENTEFSISFLERANVINLLSRNKEKTILTNNTLISKKLKDKGLNGFIYKIFAKIFFNKADKIVNVSAYSKDDLIKTLGIKEKKAVIIYNHQDLEQIKKQKEEPLTEAQNLFENPVIITSGRLIELKAQWHLIRMLKEIQKEIPETKLVFLGEGELKTGLVNLAKNLGLKVYDKGKEAFSTNNDVFFMGFQQNPYNFLAGSSLFAFTSVYEGFGNVIIDALACGLPVISSDCRAGPREILAPGSDYNLQAAEPEFAEYGILMPVLSKNFIDEKHPLTQGEIIWKNTIIKVLQDKALRDNYAKKGIIRAEDFSIDKRKEQWIKIIK